VPVLTSTTGLRATGRTRFGRGRGRVPREREAGATNHKPRIAPVGERSHESTDRDASGNVDSKIWACRVIIVRFALVPSTTST
jgi:hypothetical protein